MRKVLSRKGLCLLTTGMGVLTLGAGPVTAQSPAEKSSQATDLPPLVVEAKPSKKTAPAKKQAPPAPAAAAAPASGSETSNNEPAAESAFGPANGYVAERSATGTKTDAPILEVPQTINVVTAEQMNDQAVQSVSEALRYTPGVSVENFGALSPTDSYTRVRGFRTDLYLDGTRLPIKGDGAAAFAVEPYGLERVEVLKGPASGLYGSSGPGGLINMVSKRPTDVPINEIQIQTGSFDRAQVAFDFSGPVTADKSVLFRLTGLARDADTQVDFAEDNRLFIAPALTIRPSSQTTLTLLASYSEEDSVWPFFNLVPPQGSVLSNPNGRIPRSRYTGEPDHAAVRRVLQRQLVDIVETDLGEPSGRADGDSRADEIAQLLRADLHEDRDFVRRQVRRELRREVDLLVGLVIERRPAALALGRERVAARVAVLRPEAEAAALAPRLEGAGVRDVEVIGARLRDVGGHREGRLVLVREHERQDAARDGGVARVRRAVLEIEVVVIDFPVERRAVEHEGAEIVLAPGVALRREGVEVTHARERPLDEVAASRGDARRDDEAVTGERGTEVGRRAAERVVLLAQLADSVVGGVDVDIDGHGRMVLRWVMGGGL